MSAAAELLLAQHPSNDLLLMAACMHHAKLALLALLQDASHEFAAAPHALYPARGVCKRLSGRLPCVRGRTSGEWHVQQHLHSTRRHTKSVESTAELLANAHQGTAKSCGATVHASRSLGRLPDKRLAIAACPARPTHRPHIEKHATLRDSFVLV